MVDFQQRDTSRGLSDDPEDDSNDKQDPDEHAPDDGDAHHDDSHAHEHADDDHNHHHHDVESLGAAVVTVSSSRTLDDDPAGDAIAAAFESEGHEVVARELIGDAHGAVRDTVDVLASREDVDTVVTTGGTGVTPDDVTIEAVSALFGKELPGFGELFRMLSYDEIGTKIVGTRATAGIVEETPVFCLPGSENAARLGAEAIIVEEAGHLTGLAGR
ncbi:MogA/MoaB family molybdenum cofactor biosynthesis protein [Natranaeroarchaeum sulfidigenes]|uniref:Molybdopterin biosynthesis enzyme n=1 Tax=Natranaeroarchaeum sulfidigenes TaxID=2784880 RepID=A0A897MUG7_9EURY|nr:molybdenum cofactor synthesis domain-containing protein [Natranaeroarchaeum sulfidigenes]QSG04162.1 Molybdopterin biosynthesis enzyme [Natranaeroarchaeum sulfidigenes]